MASITFYALLDTFHNELPQPFKDAGAVADSLTGIHSSMVKCFFVVSRMCICKGSQFSENLKIEIRRAWRPCSEFSSTYPHVIMDAIENIYYSTEKCSEPPSCMCTLLSAVTRKLNDSEHMVIIYVYFRSFKCVKLMPKNPSIHCMFWPGSGFPSNATLF
jgi:hypothetical protein